MRYAPKLVQRRSPVNNAPSEKVGANGAENPDARSESLSKEKSSSNYSHSGRRNPVRYAALWVLGYGYVRS